MSTNDTNNINGHTYDRQLRGIALDAVMEKRRLDQALNAKEFAVCAGVSYSTARHWFHLPGFPVFQGVTFWQDFVRWRSAQHGQSSPSTSQGAGDAAIALSQLPPQAAHILLDS